MTHTRGPRLSVDRRLAIVRDVTEGKRSPPRVSEEHGVNVATVRKWVKRFQAHGLDGLEDQAITPDPRRNRGGAKESAEVAEAMRLVLERGMSRVKAARITGVSKSAVYRAMARHKAKP